MAEALRSHRVVVVGAGIGGLVSALLLACKGLEVTLVEAASAPGGKMRQVQVDGVAVDSGPTVFTMRWVFDQILADAGSSLDSLLTIKPLDVLARHAWRGHAPTLDLFADVQRSADAIADFSSPAEARRFLGFCDQARRLYDTLEGPYIRSERPTLASMGSDLGPRGLALLAGLGPLASLWKALSRHFHDPRMQQLFGRYATYCGSSPWQAPATLMLVAQVELDGVWAVQGGMHAVAQALPVWRSGVAWCCATARRLNRSWFKADGPAACGWLMARCCPPTRWSSTATLARWRPACWARRCCVPRPPCRRRSARCRP